jgi:hypothetical protein
MAVVSDPYAELPMRNDKYAGLCAELHLGGKRITHLEGFDKFTTLSTLWINNNKICVLNGLDSNFRLRNLHAHNNRIRSLQNSSLNSFKFLTTLTLNDNLLDNLTDTIESLKCLKHLKSLDLFGNPISQEDNYRLIVLSELTWLEILDRTPVTVSELKDAKKLKKRLNNIKNMKLTSTIDINNDDNKTLISPRTQQVNLILPQITKHLKDKRIFLEDKFLEYDKRKFGIIPENIFMFSLHEYGIIDLLNSDEINYILSKYKIQLHPNERGKTWGTSINGNAIDYRRFCYDVLPNHLQRHNIIYIPEKSMKYQMELVPEISKTTNDLKRYVKSYTLKTMKENENKKLTALFATNTIDNSFTFKRNNDVDNDGRVIYRGLYTTDLQNHNIDAWSAKVLKQLLHQQLVINNKDNHNITINDDTTISKSQLMTVLHQMTENGKALNCTISECIEKIFHEKDNVHINHVCTCLGCPLFTNRLSSTQPSSAKKAPSSAPHSSTSTTSRNGNRVDVSIQWRDLTSDEIEQLEQKRFEEANHLLETMLRTNEKKKEFSQIVGETMNKALTATRLRSLKPPTQNDNNQQSSIYYAMETAPKRSDIIVIPGLNSAQERMKKDKEFESTYNYRPILEKMGLHGDSLEIALARKKRSMTNNTSLVIDKSKPFNYNPKPSERPPQGWGTSTGLIVMK